MATVPIEERIAIRELTDLYPLFCDTHQFEKVGALFTEECLFDETCVGLAAPVRTRAALIHELVEGAKTTVGPMMHICTNHIISEFTGDTASGTCHVLAEGIFITGGTQTPFRIFGYYDDRYVKIGGRWYFKERTLRLLVPTQGGPTVGGITYDTGAKHFKIR